MSPKENTPSNFHNWIFEKTDGSPNTTVWANVQVHRDFSTPPYYIYKPDSSANFFRSKYHRSILLPRPNQSRSGIRLHLRDSSIGFIIGRGNSPSPPKYKRDNIFKQS
jgi:hypothetical protein